MRKNLLGAVVVLAGSMIARTALANSVLASPDSSPIGYANVGNMVNGGAGSNNLNVPKGAQLDAYALPEKPHLVTHFAGTGQVPLAR